MNIKGPVRLVSQPPQWRRPRTFSSIEDYPQPGWQQKAALWHETHQAPPRTYPRWPLWESLERTYEAHRSQEGYPIYHHPAREETSGHRRPGTGIYHREKREDGSLQSAESSPRAPFGRSFEASSLMPVGQALATPPVMPNTFPRLSQPSVPLLPSQRGAAAAPQVAGYQIIGATTTSSLISAGVSVGMMFLVIGAAVGVGYLYAKYPNG